MESNLNEKLVSSQTRIADNGSQKPLRVAAYYRLTSSAEEQYVFECLLMEYSNNSIISHNNWEFKGVFIDIGINNMRFNQLIKMCRNNEIDIIICKSITRFSYEPTDFLERTRLLKSLGIDIIFEKENFNILSANGELIIALYNDLIKTQSDSVMLCERIEKNGNST